MRRFPNLLILYDFTVSSSFPCGDFVKLDSSVPSLAEAVKPSFRKAKKYSENALRSVSKLHIGDDKQPASNKFDMIYYFIIINIYNGSGASNAPNVQVGDLPLNSSEVCPSKIKISGKSAPLDVTLKTTLQ
uniref:Uncharacterized protein n=1 Tax=Aegilops tauschii subsp. strangulata TaxID=200361 RepID=A0A453LD69_AEGTS